MHKSAKYMKSRTVYFSVPIANLRNIVLMSAMLLSVCGCGIFMPPTIHIDYAAQPNVERIRGAEKVKLAVVVTETRPLKPSVGILARPSGAFSSGYLNVHPKEDVGVTVSNAIRRELDARGFGAGEDIQISAEITWYGYAARKSENGRMASSYFEMLVQVNRPGQTEASFARKITGRHDERVTIDTPESAKTGLEKALKEAVAALMNDNEFIAALLPAVITPGADHGK